MDLLQSGVVAAVVGALGGGFAGFVVVRLQRTWDLDARRNEDRKARIRAAIDVVLKYLDAVDEARRTGMEQMSGPIDQLSNSDRFAIASVLRLFPDKPTWHGFFYPSNFLSEGHLQVGTAGMRAAWWKEVKAFAGQRLARLTAELERLGDADLRNLDAD